MSFFYAHSLKNENRERRWILNFGHSKNVSACACVCFGVWMKSSRCFLKTSGSLAIWDKNG